MCEHILSLNQNGEKYVILGSGREIPVHMLILQVYRGKQRHLPKG
jgi:hypothetical protein